MRIDALWRRWIEILAALAQSSMPLFLAGMMVGGVAVGGLGELGQVHGDVSLDGADHLLPHAGWTKDGAAIGYWVALAVCGG